jgi:RNA polymerase sigma-70 factor, ECF subfamily
MPLLMSTLQSFRTADASLAGEVVLSARGFVASPPLVLRVPENPPRAREARIKSLPGHASGLQVWEREGSRSSMSDKRAEWVEQFIKQRRSHLLRFARNMGANAFEPEDLVQETTIRFIQAVDSGRVPADDRQREAWLVRTLRNLFTDQCRRRKVQMQGVMDLSTGEEAATPQEPPSDSTYDSITSEQIGEAMARLSPKLRETYELHLAGKKYHEIAELLGVPSGTVGKRMHDAREKLHELLEKYLREPGEDS